MKTAQRISNFFRKYGAIIGLRFVYVVFFATLSFWIGYQIDFNRVNAQPATDYLSYSQFTVSNARVGEDVNFTVCRTYERPLHVDVTLNIYVIQRADDGTEKASQVYGRSGQGSVDGNCDNKTIRYTDFQHAPGKYEIRACMEFRVRYDLTKQVCETSNQYRIYESILTLEQQLKELQARQREVEEEINAQSGEAPQRPVAGPSENQQPMQGATGSQNSNNGNANTPESSRPAEQNGNFFQDFTCSTAGLLCP